MEGVDLLCGLTGTVFFAMFISLLFAAYFYTLSDAIMSALTDRFYAATVQVLQSTGKAPIS